MESSNHSALPINDFERLKSSLVSVISHELRTPLTYISASVEMLEISVGEPQMQQEVRRFLNIVAQGVKQLNAIIDDLLLFSNLERDSGQPLPSQIRKSVSLKALVYDVVNALKPSVQGKSQQLDVQVPEQLPDLTTDSGKLSEILLQLLSNAIKFTPAHGHICLKVVQAHQNILISVVDDGPGIPPEIHQQIFNPFFQREDYLIREHGGLGLGLTLAQRLCNFISAELKLESIPNQGTTFTVCLPVVNPLYEQHQEMQHLLSSMDELSQSHAQQEAHISNLKKQLLRYSEELRSAYQTNEQKQAELEHVYVDMINGFASALEARDPYTRGRSQRLASYSQLLAEALGLAPEERDLLEKGCLLCDIGYIGISDNVLHKNRDQILTEEEITHIQLHPKIGAHMLKEIQAFEPVIPLILYHHENWDGSGYPHRLQGESIPYFARIIRLLDAFDAMLSERSYRPRQTLAYAIAEINKCAGKQFDPALVTLFTSLWEAGKIQETLSFIQGDHF